MFLYTIVKHNGRIHQVKGNIYSRKVESVRTFPPQAKGLVIVSQLSKIFNIVNSLIDILLKIVYKPSVRENFFGHAKTLPISLSDY